jgi:hypothetical protein
MMCDTMRDYHTARARITLRVAGAFSFPATIDGGTRRAGSTR